MKKLNLPKNEIIELYLSGYGCYKIAKKYECSASSINNLLEKTGDNSISITDITNSFELINRENIAPCDFLYYKKLAK